MPVTVAPRAQRLGAHRQDGVYLPGVGPVDRIEVAADQLDLLRLVDPAVLGHRIGQPLLGEPCGDVLLRRQVAEHEHHQGVPDRSADQGSSDHRYGLLHEDVIAGGTPPRLRDGLHDVAAGGPGRGRRP
ncbi:MAG TPA: hypothetical protein VGJ53_07555, partial [Micromonosporaceae bacterium]